MDIYEVGPFHLDASHGVLLHGNEPIALGRRAVALLQALIESAGTLVSKDVLMEAAWPGQAVEESNLAVQIAALRRALAKAPGGDRWIETMPRRGYRFVGPVNAGQANSATMAPLPGAISAPRTVFAAERALIHTLPGLRDAVTGEHPAADARSRVEFVPIEPGAVLSPTNLGEPASELIGREAELGDLLSLAGARRLVTLTGPGGIGKTRLAAAIARHLLSQFADGVWLAEFSALADPGLVPGTIAAAVGLDLGSRVSAARLATALADRRLLLVLDTCEHVIDAAAETAAALLRAGSGARVIATSREPLRAEGEWVYPVPPLAVPAVGTENSEEVARYGAVRLFIERARAADPRVLTDGCVLTTIAGLCRRLDGIPLAIELAAARVPALGIAALAGRLDDRFHLLTKGWRTALPRHQTLRATLDWSYELLLPHERTILRRLAIFASGFTLNAASRVAADDQLGASNVIETVASLVAKSLVATEIDDGRYHLLDTTRAYMLEKLSEAGEHQWLAGRHAEYYRDLFELAEAESEKQPIADWTGRYGREIDNLRAALDWALSPAGDARIGVALTAAAVFLWTQLSLVDECCSRVEQALAALQPGADRDARREMKLQVALATSLISKQGPASPSVHAAWTRARALAESVNDPVYRLRSLWGLWSFHINSGRYRAALAFAEGFLALANDRQTPNDRLVGEVIVGQALHHLGNPSGTRYHLERALADDVNPDSGSLIVRYQLEHRVFARAWLAWILWLQGFPDQAMVAADRSIEEARATKHIVSLCHALSFGACPIALWVGDLVAAERYVGMLLEHATRHALVRMHAAARRFQGVLLLSQGDVTAGLPLLRTSLAELGETNISTASRFLTFLSEVAGALGRAGHVANALAAIEKALAATERLEERWIIGELLRTKGELLLLQGTAGVASAAEDLFRQALDGARRHGALSWELRASTSLARLMGDRGDHADARALLQPVYNRFTEGFDTPDLKAAKRLLEAPARTGADTRRI